MSHILGRFWGLRPECLAARSAPPTPKFLNRPRTNQENLVRSDPDGCRATRAPDAGTPPFARGSQSASCCWLVGLNLSLQACRIANSNDAEPYSCSRPRVMAPAARHRQPLPSVVTTRCSAIESRGHVTLRRAEKRPRSDPVRLAGPCGTVPVFRSISRCGPFAKRTPPSPTEY